LSAAENRRLVEAFWREVYETRDYDAVGRYFAEHGVYEDVPVPGTAAVGPAAVSRRLRIGHEPVERFEHEILRIVAEGDTVITEHAETWCFHTGERVRLPFVSVQVVENGKLVLWRDYSDFNTLMSGVPKWWLEHVSKFTVADFQKT
jgi:limonene-1,2-epoxide hydrolase